MDIGIIDAIMIAVTPPYIDHHRCAELSVPIGHDATIQTLCDLRISTSPPKPRVNNTPISNERIHKAHDNNVMAHTVERPSPVNLSIGSCLTVPQKSAIPLNFNPSLNYLAVIGGDSNSQHRGRFNNFEFQNNALNHLWWLITAPEEFYEAYALGAQDRQAYESTFRILIKCHCVDQLFNTASDKSNNTADNADVLLQELQNTGNLLLHARDQTHAFYLEILGQPKHCDVHVYNTGKGLVYHHREAVVNNKGERKIKYYTRRTFHGIEMSTERLSRLIANMSQISFRLLPRIPIYKLYFLLGRWQPNAVRPSVQTNTALTQHGGSNANRLQAKQKSGDCQQKTLLAVIKHQVSPRAFRVFKKSLLERAVTLCNPPRTAEFSIPWELCLLWHRRWVYEQAVQRAQAKAARINIDVPACDSNLCR